MKSVFFLCLFISSVLLLITSFTGENNKKTISLTSPIPQGSLTYSPSPPKSPAVMSSLLVFAEDRTSSSKNISPIIPNPSGNPLIIPTQPTSSSVYLFGFSPEETAGFFFYTSVLFYGGIMLLSMEEAGRCLLLMIRKVWLLNRFSSWETRQFFHTPAISPF